MAHIDGLLEDPKRTLGEIQDCLDKFSLGLEAEEKIDGVYVAFTADSSYKVRFARTTTMMEKGGEASSVFAERFAATPRLRDVVFNACEALRSVALEFSPSELRDVFSEGRRWLQCDVFSSNNVNVVKYDDDAVFVHSSSLFFDGSAFVRSSFTSKLFVESSRRNGYNVRGPSKVFVPPCDDGLFDLKKELAALGPRGATLEECLVAKATEALSKEGVRDQVLLMDASKRLASVTGSVSLTELKKRITYSAASLIRRSDEWKKNVLSAADIALVRFSSEALSQVRTPLVAIQEVEAKRIEDRFLECKSLVQRSRNLTATNELARAEARLGTSRVAALEGIVFEDTKGKQTKLTGSYGPINSVVGLCRYGKGKLVPPLETIFR